jgi:hypothetical protein
MLRIVRYCVVLQKSVRTVQKSVSSLPFAAKLNTLPLGASKSQEVNIIYRLQRLKLQQNILKIQE